jgi:hydrogenase expression/formation protein HypD
MVYSPLEALALARAKRERQIVFFAIGFETTTPPTAAIILQAAAERLDNFSVLCCHVLTPAAILGILDNARAQKMIDGMIGPAHVSTVIGSASYEFIPARYGKPVVITGFEPLDMLQGILMLIRQTNDGTARVENEFVRAVNQTGNEKAQAISKQCFEVRESFEWRGLGVLPASALAIRSAWSALDAEARFSVPYAVIPDHKACECAAILRGEKAPSACKAFGSVCTPDSPLGACMVSSEGACAASYTYGEARRHHRKPGRQT